MKERIYVIGDERKEDPTFSIMGSYADITKINYLDIMNTKSPISTDATILLCFPYELWNIFVEKSDILYGMGKFGDRIKNLAETIDGKMSHIFPGAIYVNDPMAMLIERDKQLAKKILSSAGIQVAKDVPKNIDAVLEEIENGHQVYIKPRYGSMGKGISYISKRKWTTNFNYDGQVIHNHEDDFSWKEIEITGDTHFLSQILEEDVVVERAIVNPLTNGLKFDFRVNVMFGETDLEFALGRCTDKSSITNISQGARELTPSQLTQYVPQEKILEATKLIQKSAGILGFNYAGGDVIFEGKDFIPVFLEINSFPGPPDFPERSFLPRLYQHLKKFALKQDERINNKSRH